MRRRVFLRAVSGGAVLGVIGCGEVGSSRDDDDAPAGADAAPGSADASPPGADAGGPAADAAPGCDAGFVVMYDTHAQALYMDGTLGPLTGIIYVDYILADAPVELEFWHGHGGVQHRFTVTPAHFARLKRGERVTITTTVVDDHQHELFIDPADPGYRVDGAEPVSVPLDGC